MCVLDVKGKHEENSSLAQQDRRTQGLEKKWNLKVEQYVVDCPRHKAVGSTIPSINKNRLLSVLYCGSSQQTGAFTPVWLDL